MRKWWRRRRFITAYKILRNEYERHKCAGHDVQFYAVNESYITLFCPGCPELRPQNGGLRELYAKE